MVARRPAIEDALNADFGHHSRHETAIMEVVGVVEGIRYLRRNLRAFMRPTRRHVALHMRFGKARVEYQPLGVVGVMSPWNYPVILSLMPVVTAIAAGNLVMLKPSEFTLATNAVAEPYHVRQCHHQGNDHAHRAGRSAFRRRRG
jgi:coniferyl-aldehyde dehydrogenase